MLVARIKISAPEYPETENQRIAYQLWSSIHTLESMKHDLSVSVALWQSFGIEHYAICVLLMANWRQRVPTAFNS